MKFALITSLFILFSINGYAQTQPNKDDDAVVLLLVMKNGKLVGSGTGFVVAPEIVATNFHVAGTNDVVVLTPGKGQSVKPFNTTKLWGSSGYDLQLLKVDGLQASPLTISTYSLDKGADIKAIGYPGVAESAIEFDGVESTITKGIVGRIIEASWKEGGPKLSVIQHSASINKGNSGGPLLDLCGRVVGVNTLKAFSIVEVKSGIGFTSQTEGIFYASAVDILLNQLRKLNINVAVKSEPCHFTNASKPTSISSIQNSSFTTIGVIGALFLAGLAVFFSLKKKELIKESFTQFQRRAGHSPKSNIDNDKFNYQLNGSDSNGRSVRILIDQKFPVGSLIHIGRDPKLAKIAIDDPTVSRDHAIIEIKPSGLRVRDLNSTNGTWVDSNQIHDKFVDIAVGQTLTLGKAKFKLFKF